MVAGITGLHIAFDAGAAFINFTVAIVVLAITKRQVCGIALGVCVGVAERSIFNQARMFPRVAVVAIRAEARGANAIAVTIFVGASWGLWSRIGAYHAPAIHA